MGTTRAERNPHDEVYYGKEGKPPDKPKSLLPLPVAIMIGKVRIPVQMCNLTLPLGCRVLKDEDGLGQRVAHTLLEMWLTPAEHQMVAEALGKAFRHK